MQKRNRRLHLPDPRCSARTPTEWGCGCGRSPNLCVRPETTARKSKKRKSVACPRRLMDQEVVRHESPALRTAGARLDTAMFDSSEASVFVLAWLTFHVSGQLSL